MIRFFSEDIPLPLKQRKAVRNWLAQVIRLEGQSSGPVNYIFCNDAFLLDMNRQYLQHDYYTDVITFEDEHEHGIAGEVYLSIDRVRDNAKQLQVRSRDELHRVMVHGLLHLLGYKDKAAADQAVMTRKEDYYLSLRDF